MIILTYMQRHFLDECLNSILSQTYPNIEIIVCDDSSADFDPLEVEDYIYDHAGENVKNVVVYQQPHNVGTVANAQKGVELSTGVYFKLHAGDDLLYDDTVLERIFKNFSTRDVGILAARSVACQHDGTITGDYYPPEQFFQEMQGVPAQKQFELIGTQAWGAYINAPAVFWTREFFDKIGGFDLSYLYTEDWPMWLKITAAGYEITMVNTVTTIYRYGGISNDSSELNLSIGKTHYQESIRMLRENVLPKFQSEGNIKKTIRCRHAIKCLEVRMETEGRWDRWTLAEKLGWRIRMLPFLLLSWLYRVRAHGVVLQGKVPQYIICACVVMFALRVEIWPGVSCQHIWTSGFLVGFVWLLLKLILIGMLKVFRLGLLWKAREMP